mmetsp:Transcript_22758/g.43258  ORF Transcript_22758/g.43258 Transcript_22758/m.43258 type:complete len:122 (-) Transcript_22758:294-659(-)|eukprot:scaffold1123_cov168-Amphora_coffeaeformis.AAC.37
MLLQMTGLAVWAVLPGEAFLLSANSRRPSAARTRSLLAAEPPKQQPTPDQQEQLDKYGATPETSMEILFDQLMRDDSSSDDFLEKTGADEEAREKWQSFIANMKQAKQGGGPENPNDGDEE